jgi:serine/threonine-protein kinase RsbW
MALIQHANLQTETDIEAMTTVTEWFNQFQRPPLTQMLWMEAQLALLEGFTNAVLHAHRQLDPETPIELEAQLYTEQFQLSIWDHGAPYDFEATLRHLQQLTTDATFVPQEREAHWGSILLLKLRNQSGWHITYTRQPDQRNCLLIEKVFEK